MAKSDLKKAHTAYMSDHYNPSVSQYSKRIAESLLDSGIKIKLMHLDGEAHNSIWGDVLDKVVRLDYSSGENQGYVSGDIQHCPRDWGIFSDDGKTFYAYDMDSSDERWKYGGFPEEFLRTVDADIKLVPFAGGHIINDDEVAIISKNNIDKSGLEKTLEKDILNPNIDDVHMDYFMNFIDDKKLFYNRTLAVRKESWWGWEKADFLKNLDKVADTLAGKGYEIITSDRFDNVKNQNLDWNMKTHIVMLGNILALEPGKIIMPKDFDQTELDRYGMEHIPDKIRKEGVDVIEVDLFQHIDGKGPVNQYFYELAGGPRCMTLIERD